MALHNCDEVAVAGFGYDMSAPHAPLHYYENIKMSAIKEVRMLTPVSLFIHFLLRLFQKILFNEGINISQIYCCFRKQCVFVSLDLLWL